MVKCSSLTRIIGAVYTPLCSSMQACNGGNACVLRRFQCRMLCRTTRRRSFL